VVAIVLLVASVATILGINISVSKQQYALVSLRAQQADLVGQNQRLKEEIDNQQAPQVLAAKAKDLGLVNSSKFAVLDVSNATISGDATPVDANGAVTQSVPVPLPLKTRAAVAPTVEVQKVKESQTSMAGKNLNGGTIPAPSQKSTTPTPKATTPAKKN
jgi:hypothetical protein